MADLLFVYGTLRPGHAPQEIAPIVDQLNLIGRATVRGHVLDLGTYPGIVLDDTAPTVPGVLLSLPADPTILAQLDAYEGFIPTNPEDSLFLRVPTTAILDDTDTLTACWIYIYNR